MDLTEARAWVRQFARNAGDSSQYSDAQIDRAIQHIGVRFTHETRIKKSAASVALAAGIAAVDVSAIADLDLTHLMSALVSTNPRPLELIDWEDLWEHKILRDGTNSTQTGPPTLLAFRDYQHGEVWPIPAANDTLYLRYYTLFALWTPGGVGTLNLDDDILTQILPFVSCLLQVDEPEHAYASNAFQRYLEIERKYQGHGNLGGRVAKRR